MLGTVCTGPWRPCSGKGEGGSEKALTGFGGRQDFDAAAGRIFY